LSLEEQNPLEAKSVLPQISSSNIQTPSKNKVRFQPKDPMTEMLKQ
jgi:hypothetical protein